MFSFFEKLINNLYASLLVTSSKNVVTKSSIIGDVVQTVNQTGGITAHTLNLNQAQKPEILIEGNSEKTSSEEYRLKIIFRGVGKLPYSNWAVILNFDSEVLRKEEVPSEVSAGPWQPLNIANGSLRPDQIFLGFTKFEPSQFFSMYFYSKRQVKLNSVTEINS